MKRQASSYRDPDGYVACDDDGVYRYVLNDNAPILSPAHKDFFDKAVKKGLLVPFERVQQGGNTGQGAVFRLHKLPLVTYPYEWGFEQLKEAALVTLDIGLLALEYGLTLKDATAFNVQQYEGRMVFIDHTSFESSDALLPWRPYSQFCRHFIVPLLMTSRSGRNANKLFCISLDGPDIEEACNTLPFIDRFRPATFVHIYLHNYLINNFKDTGSDKKVKTKRTGSQKAYLQHLRQFIQRIAPPEYNTEWYDYYNNTNYDQASFGEKERLVRDVISQKRHKCLWDLGGNNGHFSRIMSEYADLVVSMDIDYAAIDLNFIKNRQLQKKNIFPLVMDLTNPSPALGLGNSERTTINSRSAPDTIVALALIHHLGITCNIPFAMLARQLYSYKADLVIEYVDRPDSQFQKLMRSKDEPYDWYNQDNFEKCFFMFFDLAEKYPVSNAHRCLYHLKPKPGIPEHDI